MRYRVTSQIWLSLERFYAAGMTSEETRDTIEGLGDPYSPGTKLLCSDAGYNGNWKVETSALSSSQIADVAGRIENALELKLREMRQLSELTSD